MALPQIQIELIAYKINEGKPNERVAAYLATLEVKGAEEAADAIADLLVDGFKKALNPFNKD